MKSLNITFNNKEFRELRTLKRKLNLTWEGFFLALAKKKDDTKN